MIVTLPTLPKLLVPDTVNVPALTVLEVTKLPSVDMLPAVILPVTLAKPLIDTPSAPLVVTKFNNPDLPRVLILNELAELSVNVQEPVVVEVILPAKIGLAIVPTATIKGIVNNLLLIVVLVPGKNDIEAKAKLEPSNVAAGLYQTA